jgi:hypothetical protein
MSPQKHHTKNALFPKPPSKTPAKTTKIPLSSLSKKNLKKTGLGLQDGLEK